MIEASSYVAQRLGGQHVNARLQLAEPYISPSYLDLGKVRRQLARGDLSDLHWFGRCLPSGQSPASAQGPIIEDNEITRLKRRNEELLEQASACRLMSLQ